jgi:hypothetical protein
MAFTGSQVAGNSQATFPVAVALPPDRYNCSHPTLEEDAMNSDDGGNRGSWHAGLLAVMAAAAVLATAAACGGGASSAGSASAGSTDQMLAYSQCMRAHGVPDFPDPDAAGNIHVAPGNPDDPMNNGQEQIANTACQHLLPAGGQPSTGADQQYVDQLLTLAECMRTHGLPSFPDPIVSGSNVTLPFEGVVNFNSAQFKNAERACKSLIPAGLFSSGD